jgi:Ca2+-binding EF-hand superfamily protein
MMMERFDKDGNGSITYEEFLQEAEGFIMLCSESRVKKCFDMFDMNEDGDIELKEVQKVLTGGIKQIS